MAARKRWRCVYPGSREVDEFATESKTYDRVAEMRDAWVAGGPTGSITVQVDEGLGAGWQPHEHINFAEEA